MHKRGLCRRAVSVCLSVTFVYSVETNKHILKLLSPSGSFTIFFANQTSWQYSDRDPVMGPSNAGGVGKNRDSRWIAGYRSMTGGVWTTTALYRTDCHTSVNLYQNQHGRPRRRERNLFIRSGKYEAEVTKWLGLITEDCARPIVLLHLTTDRHEATRGLSATAGLLITLWFHTVAVFNLH